MVIQLMVIIEYFHLNHYNYRDLKPNNIIFDVNKNVFLFDLNRMILYNDESKLTKFSNDFPFIYAGSEYDNGECSFLSDVFSIGKMIYFITHMKTPTYENCIQYVFESRFNDMMYLFINLCIKNKECRPTISKLINLFFIAFYGTEDQLNSFKTVIDINKKFVMENHGKVEKDDIYNQSIIKEIRLRVSGDRSVNTKQIMRFYSGCYSFNNQRDFEEKAIISVISLSKSKI